MTAEPPPGQNPYGSAPPPYGSAPPPPQGGYPPAGAYGPPQGAYGVPQQAPLPPGVPAPLAEWWERWVARFIDGLIFGVIYFILNSIFSSMFGPPSVAEILAGESVSGSVFLPGFLAAIIGYGAYTAYDYVMHSKDGQTVGKKVMKIQVVRLGGGAPLPAEVMKRSILIPGAWVLYGIPIVSFLVGIFTLVVGILIITDKPRQQGLHDKVAGTVVVKAPR
jgi:uncharacterized RDD family membrane protein YckC